LIRNWSLAVAGRTFVLEPGKSLPDYTRIGGETDLSLLVDKHDPGPPGFRRYLADVGVQEMRLVLEHPALKAGEDELTQVADRLAHTFGQLAFMQTIEENEEGNADHEQRENQPTRDAEA